MCSDAARGRSEVREQATMNAARSRLPEILLIAVTFLTWIMTAQAQQLGLFRVEGQAQMHCPNDTVVWLDLKKRIYYLQRQRLYGAGNTAVFACRKEARRNGYRRSLLGWR